MTVVIVIMIRYLIIVIIIIIDIVIIIVIMIVRTIMIMINPWVPWGLLLIRMCPADLSDHILKESKDLKAPEDV